MTNDKSIPNCKCQMSKNFLSFGLCHLTFIDHSISFGVWDLPRIKAEHSTEHPVPTCSGTG